MKITIEKTKLDDIKKVAAALRDEDFCEAMAQHGDAMMALSVSAEKSDVCCTLFVDNIPCAIYGRVAASILGDSANIWLLGTPELNKIKKSFMRISKHVINDWLKEYPVLWAQVDGRYGKTHRWLKWLGFQKFPGYELHGVEFNNFMIRRA
jgi:hypothetical protein